MTEVTKEQVFAILFRIQSLCKDSRNGEAMMHFVLERMQFLAPVLRLL